MCAVRRFVFHFIVLCLFANLALAATPARFAPPIKYLVGSGPNCVSAVDLNHDGKISIDDARVILQAVDRVEAAHPELVGGLGLYTSSLYRTPYVHIDTRGTRSRWKG